MRSGRGNTLASSRCDFGITLGTLRFAATETQKTFDIPINQDAYTEGPETFTVKLVEPHRRRSLALPSTATVTINDSASPTPNAIDDTDDIRAAAVSRLPESRSGPIRSGVLEEQHRQVQRPGATTGGTNVGAVYRSAADSDFSRVLPVD